MTLQDALRESGVTKAAQAMRAAAVKPAKVPKTNGAGKEPFKPSPVTGRKTLWAGSSIEVVVSSTPHLRESARVWHRVGHPYHECYAPITGGNVLVFLYGLPEGTKPGTRVVGNVEVMKRFHEDGRTSFAVNVNVLPDHVGNPNHRLVVHPRGDQFEWRVGTEFYHALAGGKGVIEIRRVRRGSTG